MVAHNIFSTIFRAQNVRLVNVISTAKLSDSRLLVRFVRLFWQMPFSPAGVRVFYFWRRERTRSYISERYKSTRRGDGSGGGMVERIGGREKT